MSTANLDKIKENRIWWLVLALMATATALLVLNYITKESWQIIVLTLFATFVTGVAVNGIAQGATNLLQAKGNAQVLTSSAIAEKTQAETEHVKAMTTAVATKSNTG